MKVRFKKLNKNAVTPVYANKTDACFDMVSTSRNIKEKFVEYGTNIAMEIPDGYVGLLFSRSSVTKKDLILKNSVGIIDSGYRGEIKFRFMDFGDTIYEIGERVGQMMIIPIPKIELLEVDELEDSDRGEGGFGSTGK